MTYLIDTNTNLVFKYSTNKHKYYLHSVLSSFKLKESKEVKIEYVKNCSQGE